MTSSNLSDEVREGILEKLEIVAAKFNVGYKEYKKYGEQLIVRLCKDDRGPRQCRNYIYIPKKFAGNNRAYIEEGIHFLRWNCSKQDDALVHQFFAGMAVLLFDDDKNLLFWKQKDVKDLSSLLERKGIRKKMRDRIEYALDSIAGYEMSYALYKQQLIDHFLNTYPKIIKYSDEKVIASVLGFCTKTF